MARLSIHIFAPDIFSVLINIYENHYVILDHFITAEGSSPAALHLARVQRVSTFYIRRVPVQSRQGHENHSNQVKSFSEKNVFSWNLIKSHLHQIAHPFSQM